MEAATLKHNGLLVLGITLESSLPGEWSILPPGDAGDPQSLDRQLASGEDFVKMASMENAVSVVAPAAGVSILI